MNIERLKEASFYLVIGVAANALSLSISSDFLAKFLNENLITILIALLAINTTTGSVVMTKLRELADKSSVDFSTTMIEIRKSILEQVVLIIVALVISVLLGSKILLGMHQLIKPALDSMLISVFAAGLYNLYDTANSIFIIMKHEKDK